MRDTLFLTALRERAASVAEGRVPGGAPVIFFGAETRDALRKIHLLRARLVDTGVLWIVRPKGSKAISEADVFDALRTAGLVDTKVVAFSKTHTAHKAMIPVEMRGQAVRRPPNRLAPAAPAGHGHRQTRRAPRSPKAAAKKARREARQEAQIARRVGREREEETAQARRGRSSRKEPEFFRRSFLSSSVSLPSACFSPLEGLS